MISLNEATIGREEPSAAGGVQPTGEGGRAGGETVKGPDHQKVPGAIWREDTDGTGAAVFSP